MGLEFNLFLGKSGIAYFSGAITQTGENVVNTWGELENLNELFEEGGDMPEFAREFYRGDAKKE